MSAYDQLEKIKGTLLKIRDSEALQNVEADSDVAKGLAGVFGGVSDVLKQNSAGIASSKGARNAVTNGEAVVSTKGNSVMDAMSKLRQENAKLQSAFEEEKSTREGLEGNQSINEQRTNQELQDIIANFQAGGTGAGGKGTETAGGTGTGTTAPDGSTNTPAEGTVEGGINTEGDPVAQALSEDYNNQQEVVRQQLEALAAFVDAEDADVQSSLKNIQATADLQAKRVAKENERLAQASQVAGIVSGRGMYSPYEHEGIVSEVIQDGLDRITEIELTAQEAKLEAKKAHREFRYEAFVQSTEMVSALSELKRQTIVDIGKRLQEVEAAEREKMTFDQEQQDRTSFILAAELVNATPEEIRAAALANGVNPGALMRTVADYKNEQEAVDLDRQVAEESILSSQNNRRIANRRLELDEAAAVRAANAAAGEGDEVEKPLTVSEIKDFTDLYGLEGTTAQTAIPSDWTRSDLSNFRNMYPDAPSSEVPKLIQKYNGLVELISNNPEVTDEQIAEKLSSSESVEQKVSSVEKIMTDGDWQWWGKGTAAAKISAKEGDSSKWRGDKKDAQNWLKKKSTQDRIKELADDGYEAYEIAQMLKDENGVQ